MLTRATFTRVTLVLSIVASLCVNFSPAAQAQTSLDEPSPTETPVATPTETPEPEVTDLSDSGDVIYIPITNPDVDALATATSEPDSEETVADAPALFAAQSFSFQSAPTFSPETVAADAGIQDVPNIIYNPTADNYLTVWSDANAPYRVRGRLLAADGMPQGNAFTIANSAGRPSTNRLAYNPVDNTYFVLWAEPNGLITVYGSYTLSRYNLYMARLSADGTLLTSSPLLITNELTYFNFTAGFYDVAYNSQTNEFLLAWMQPPGGVVGTVVHPHRLDGATIWAGCDTPQCGHTASNRHSLFAQSDLQSVEQ
jgi:hypothetical protein